MIHKKYFRSAIHLFFLLPVISLSAQTAAAEPSAYRTISDILYIDSTITPLTDYARERCRLDLYYPENQQGFPTVVWFHGGGIKAGNKFIPEALKEQGIAVVAVNYRLHPQVSAPVYIEDAAAAIAWTMKHILDYGGDPDLIFISGHSAGGYLASMVGLDATYLQAHQLDANDLAGIISYSGHAITHFTIRTERELDWHQVQVDKYAPLTHIRKDAPPLILILGDRELELYGRYEEVAYLWRMMQLIGHPYTRIYELQGYNHGQMAEPAHHILLTHVREISKQKSLSDHQAKPWSRHTIDASSTGADGVKFADINGDGRVDIATGWEEGSITKIYLHPGPDEVRKQWPNAVIGITPNVEDAVFMDFNADGSQDVISCTERGTEKIYIHLAPPGNRLDPDGWKQQALPASVAQMMWMYAEPVQVDGRGHTDLVAAGKGDGSAIGWFEAPADPARLEDWVWHTISPVGWVMSIIPADMDGDGDTDLVITDRQGELRGCRWLENPDDAEARKRPWPSHLIGGAGLEVMFMTLADLNGDGQREAVVAERSEGTIRIFYAPDKPGVAWREQILPLPPFTGAAKSVEVGDLNGDGRADLVISTNTNGAAKDGLIWLDGRHIDDTRPEHFKSISGAHNAKYDRVELMDVDEDGDLDVVICEENYGEQSQGLGVVWYENE